MRNQDQTAVEINIVEGERRSAVDNRSIARFTLPLVVPREPELQIEVTFDIDANHRFTVSAAELRSGGHQVEQVLDYR